MASGHKLVSILRPSSDARLRSITDTELETRPNTMCMGLHLNRYQSLRCCTLLQTCVALDLPGDVIEALAVVIHVRQHFARSFTRAAAQFAEGNEMALRSSKGGMSNLF